MGLRRSRTATTLVTGGLLAVIALTAMAVSSAATPNSPAGGPATHAATASHGVASKSRPIVIGHRGASGYRPEHTLASYELAIRMGADFVEPDLVSTKDGALVARHENDISATTNVAEHPEFAARRTTKTIDGLSVTGWFTEDFTLAELKTLRAKERIPDVRPDSTVFDGLYEVPTLQEVIDLAKRNGVGIYPETKHPTYFDSIGLSLEEPLVRILHANGYRDRRAPVFIQSFEVGNLQQLHRMTKLPLVQLVDAAGAPFDLRQAGDPRTYADLVTPQGLETISTYAQGVGLNKNLIIPRDAAGRLLAPTTVIRDAHRAGLLVHAWTFRRENTFLPLDDRAGNPANPAFPRAIGNAPTEFARFFRLGLDGMFSDNPDVAVGARTAVFGDR